MISVPSLSARGRSGYHSFNASRGLETAMQVLDRDLNRLRELPVLASFRQMEPLSAKSRGKIFLHRGPTISDGVANRDN